MTHGFLVVIQRHTAELVEMATRSTSDVDKRRAVTLRAGLEGINNIWKDTACRTMG